MNEVEDMAGTQVPSGYKRTEVGVVPEEWEVVSLGSLMKFKNGINASKEQYGKGRKFVNVLDIINNITLDYDTIVGRVEVGDALFAANAVTYGDVLFQRSSETREEVGQSIVYLDRDTAATFGGFVILGKKHTEYFPEYINYQLRSLTIRNQITSQSGGSTRYNISQSSLQTVQLPLPPLPEQRAIAGALSEVDALLAALDGLVAKKEAVKRGVMEEVLGSASQLKVESAGCTIDDIVIKILGGGTPSRGIESYWNGRIPWMTVKDFTSFDPLATEEYITSEGLANSSTNIIESGTLILATRIALGKCQIYAVDVAINQDLKAIYFASDVYPKFMYYWFIFQENIIESLGSGSTVKGISLTDLRSLPICLPSYTEQRAIATLLSDLDAELAALRARREKLTRVKAGMMGELLTGRVRLV